MNPLNSQFDNGTGRLRIIGMRMPEERGERDRDPDHGYFRMVHDTLMIRISISEEPVSGRTSGSAGARLKSKGLNLCVAILLTFSGSAQAQQTPSVDELIKQLIAYSKDYRAKLPSLECDESIVSQQIKGDKIKWEVKVEATLRQIRDSKDPDEFKDTYTFNSVGGHPPKGRFKLPYLVSGAFANAIGFAPGAEDTRECFNYALSREDGDATLRLEVTAKSERTASSCKDVFDEYHKIVLVDATTGIVKHITRSMSPAAALKHHEVVFASVDYAPQSMGELTIWLPIRVESHNGNGERRMTARFSNYHRYTGEARVLPGVVELPGTNAPIP